MTASSRGKCKFSYNHGKSDHDSYRTVYPSELFTPCNKTISQLISQQQLQLYNTPAAHKPITTLRRLLTIVKVKDNRRTDGEQIKCCDCQATYIGETGRNLSMRLTEHKRATRNGDVNHHIAEHHLQTKHQIDWDSATCIAYFTNYYQRLT